MVVTTAGLTGDAVAATRPRTQHGASAPASDTCTVGMVMDGRRVRHVVGNLPANIAGFVARDFVLKVNGTNATDDTALSLLQDGPEGSVAYVLVQRPDTTGQTVQVELRLERRMHNPGQRGTAGNTITTNASVSHDASSVSQSWCRDFENASLDSSPLRQRDLLGLDQDEDAANHINHDPLEVSLLEESTARLQQDFLSAKESIQGLTRRPLQLTTTQMRQRQLQQQTSGSVLVTKAARNSGWVNGPLPELDMDDVATLEARNVHLSTVVSTMRQDNARRLRTVASALDHIAPPIPPIHEIDSQSPPARKYNSNLAADTSMALVATPGGVGNRNRAGASSAFDALYMRSSRSQVGHIGSVVQPELKRQLPVTMDHLVERLHSIAGAVASAHGVAFHARRSVQGEHDGTFNVEAVGAASNRLEAACAQLADAGRDIGDVSLALMRARTEIVDRDAQLMTAEAALKGVRDDIVSIMDSDETTASGAAIRNLQEDSDGKSVFVPPAATLRSLLVLAATHTRATLTAEGVSEVESETAARSSAHYSAELVLAANDLMHEINELETAAARSISSIERQGSDRARDTAGPNSLYQSAVRHSSRDAGGHENLSSQTLQDLRHAAMAAGQKLINAAVAVGDLVSLDVAKMHRAEEEKEDAVARAAAATVREQAMRMHMKDGMIPDCPTGGRWTLDLLLDSDVAPWIDQREETVLLKRGLLTERGSLTDALIETERVEEALEKRTDELQQANSATADAEQRVKQVSIAYGARVSEIDEQLHSMALALQQAHNLAHSKDASLHEMQQCVASVEDELDRTREDLKANQTARAEAEVVVAQLTTSVQSKDATIATMTETIELRDQTIADLTERLAERSAVAAQLPPTEERLRATDAEIADGAALIAELQKTLRSEQETIVELTTQLNTSRTQCGSLETQLASKVEEVGRTRKAHDTLTRRISDLEETTEDATRAAFVAEGKADAMVAEKAEWDADATRLSGEVRAAAERQIMFEAELTQSQNAVASLQSTVHTLEMAIKQRDENISSLNDQIQSLQSTVESLQEVERQLATSREETAQVTATFERAALDLEEALGRATDSEALAESREQARVAAESLANNREVEITSLSTTIQELRRDILEAGRAEELHSMTATEATQALQRELQEALRQHEADEVSLAAKDTSIASLSSQLEEAHHQIQAISEKMKMELNARIATLENELDEARKPDPALMDEIAAREMECNTLRGQLSAATDACIVERLWWKKREEESRVILTESAATLTAATAASAAREEADNTALKEQAVRAANSDMESDRLGLIAASVPQLENVISVQGERMEALQQDVDDAKEESSVQNEALAAALEELSALNASLQLERSKMAALEAAKMGSEDESAIAVARATHAHQTEVAALRLEIDSLRSTVGSNVATITALEMCIASSVDAARHSADIAEKAMAPLQSAMATIPNPDEHAQSMLALQRLPELELTVSKALAAVASREDEVVQWKDAHAKLSAELAAEQREGEASRQVLTASANELESQSNKLVAMQKQCEAAESRMAALQTEQLRAVSAVQSMRVKPRSDNATDTEGLVLSYDVNTQFGEPPVDTTEIETRLDDREQEVSESRLQLEAALKDVARLTAKDEASVRVENSLQGVAKLLCSTFSAFTKAPLTIDDATAEDTVLAIKSTICDVQAAMTDVLNDGRVREQSLQVTIDKSERNVLSLQSDIAMLKGSLSGREEEEAARILAAQRDYEVKVNADMEKLREGKKLCEAEHALTQKQLISSRERVKVMESELQGKFADIEELQHKMSVLEADDRERVTALEESLADVSIELMDRRSGSKTMSSNLESLQKDLENSQVVNAQLEKTLETCRAELRDSVLALDRETNANGALKARLSEYDNACETNEKETASLMQALSDSNEVMSKQEQELASVTKSRNDAVALAETTTAQYTGKLQAAEARIKVLTDHIASLEAEHCIKDHTGEKLEDDYQRQVDVLNDAVINAQVAQETASSLQAKLSSAEAELLVMKQMHLSLQTEHEQAQQSLADAQRDVQLVPTLREEAETATLKLQAAVRDGDEAQKHAALVMGEAHNWREQVHSATERVEAMQLHVVRLMSVTNDEDRNVPQPSPPSEQDTALSALNDELGSLVQQLQLTEQQHESTVRQLKIESEARCKGIEDQARRESAIATEKITTAVMDELGDVQLLLVAKDQELESTRNEIAQQSLERSVVARDDSLRPDVTAEVAVVEKLVECWRCVALQEELDDTATQLNKLRLSIDSSVQPTSSESTAKLNSTRAELSNLTKHCTAQEETINALEGAVASLATDLEAEQTKSMQLNQSLSKANTELDQYGAATSQDLITFDELRAVKVDLGVSRSETQWHREELARKELQISALEDSFHELSQSVSNRPMAQPPASTQAETSQAGPYGGSTVQQQVIRDLKQTVKHREEEVVTLATEARVLRDGNKDLRARIGVVIGERDALSHVLDGRSVADAEVARLSNELRVLKLQNASVTDDAHTAQTALLASEGRLAALIADVASGRAAFEALELEGAELSEQRNERLQKVERALEASRAQASAALQETHHLRALVAAREDELIVALHASKTCDSRDARIASLESSLASYKRRDSSGDYARDGLSKKSSDQHDQARVKQLEAAVEELEAQCATLISAAADTSKQSHAEERFEAANEALSKVERELQDLKRENRSLVAQLDATMMVVDAREEEAGVTAVGATQSLQEVKKLKFQVARLNAEVTSIRTSSGNEVAEMVASHKSAMVKQQAALTAVERDLQAESAKLQQALASLEAATTTAESREEEATSAAIEQQSAEKALKLVQTKLGHTEIELKASADALTQAQTRISDLSDALHHEREQVQLKAQNVGGLTVDNAGLSRTVTEQASQISDLSTQLNQCRVEAATVLETQRATATAEMNEALASISSALANSHFDEKLEEANALIAVLQRHNEALETELREKTEAVYVLQTVVSQQGAAAVTLGAELQAAMSTLGTSVAVVADDVISGADIRHAIEDMAGQLSQLMPDIPSSTPGQGRASSSKTLQMTPRKSSGRRPAAIDENPADVAICLLHETLSDLIAQLQSAHEMRSVVQAEYETTFTHPELDKLVLPLSSYTSMVLHLSLLSFFSNRVYATCTLW